MRTKKTLLLIAVGAIANGIYGYILGGRSQGFLTLTGHVFTIPCHFLIGDNILFAVSGALSGSIIAIIAIKEIVRVWNKEIDAGNLAWSIPLGAATGGLFGLFGLFVGIICQVLFFKLDTVFVDTITSVFYYGGIWAGMAIAAVATIKNAYNVYKEYASPIFNTLALIAVTVGGFEGWIQSGGGIFGALIGVIGGYKITSYVYNLNDPKFRNYNGVDIVSALFYSAIFGIFQGFFTALSIAILLIAAGWTDIAMAYTAGKGGMIGTIISSMLIAFCLSSNKAFGKK